MKPRPIIPTSWIRGAIAAITGLGMGSCAPLGEAACVDGQACVRPTVCAPGQASAQFKKQEPPPSIVDPRRRFAVSLTFANCSGQTWTPDNFALRPVGVAAASTWGISRVALPAEVPDGHEVVVPFEASAPATSGAFSFSWAVAHDGVETFEEPSPPVEVRVAAAADCAASGPPVRFVSQVPPAEFVATGAAVHASVTFANCGTETWSKKSGIALGSRSAPEDLWGPRTIDLPFDVPPGRVVTIPVELIAPNHPGRFTASWQLAKKGEWLSEPAPPADATVLEPVDCSRPGPPARFLSQKGPPELVPNQAVDVSARFANCSGGTWSGFSLDSALPNRDRPWGGGPIALPLSVGDGFAIDIPFQVRAPGSPGVHPYRFGISRPEGSLLDEPTPLLEVNVRCVPNCGDHNCGGDGCGGSCGGCPGGWSCDGAHCQPPDLPQCGLQQWWNTYLTYQSIDYGWFDTDIGVSASTPVQLRHDSRLDKTGVYGWGYMPEFTDLATGLRFRMLHLRPQNQNATTVGHVYPAGYVVGLSGGDTFDTGKPMYSTGAHLCIQTISPYRTVFPTGQDACR